MIQPSKKGLSVPNISYTQLWKEEHEVLADLVSQVPEGGTIVEIGTAQGGTAMLFCQAAKDKDVKVFTVDVAPSRRAYRNLRDTRVEIIAKTSQELAPDWMHVGGGLIDLLFIDGDHSFKSIFEDFDLWVRYLQPGGLVVFHDYDPIERGGIRHLGVRVCLDTVLRMNLLGNPAHKFKLLIGNVKEPTKARLPLEECFSTFIGIGAGIVKTREKIFSTSIKEGIEALKSREVPFDSLQACYCIDYALKTDYDYVDFATRDPQQLRRWAETLLFFDYDSGGSLFPDRCKEILQPAAVGQLSKMIAREQVRVALLLEILQAVVDWSP